MKIACRLGLHDYVKCGKENITVPKRGPYDPRSEQDRTYSQEVSICVQCGNKAEYINDCFA